MLDLFDASVVVARMREEPLSDDSVRRLGDGGVLSSVNWSEVWAKAKRDGYSTSRLERLRVDFSLRIVPLNEDLATTAAELEPAGRPLGLSLADRCALATALALDRALWTTDRAFLGLPPDLRRFVRYAR